jgi:DNA processing protein
MTASDKDILIAHISEVPRGKRYKLSERGFTLDMAGRAAKRDIENMIEWKIQDEINWGAAEKDAERSKQICRLRGINTVSMNEKLYPPLLRESYAPPFLLYFLGELPNPEKPLLGMVGTRKPTRDAPGWAYQCGFEMGEAGVGVASGLALGIDAASHRGNVDGGGKSAAVLGSAVDEIYPQENRGLAKKILDRGGIILSEYKPGTHPTRWTFPERNRIISALSRSVVIVQAGEKSGALITASFAADEGRDILVAGVGAVSGPPQNAGTVRLVRDGAKAVFGAADILRGWNMSVNEHAKKTALKMELNGDYGRERIVKTIQMELGIDD